MSDMTSVYSASRLAPPAVEPEAGFSLSIRLYASYEQVVDFRLPGVTVLGLDERPPTGNGWGPSPAHLLGAAVGACVGARLLAWLREHGVDVRDMRTEVTGSFVRSATGERRIARLTVGLIPIFTSSSTVTMPSSKELLGDSVVARSLGGGIDIQLSITPEAPPHHAVLHECTAPPSSQRPSCVPPPPSSSPSRFSR